MDTAALFYGLVFICCQFTEKSSAEEFVSSGLEESVVESECRDRYLWIHVRSLQTPRFEAKDVNGVHSLSEPLASRCGYTISTFRMDSFTTVRASYYSCFTQTQNDEVFTFSFNVIVSDAGGKWISWPVSAVCSGLTWTHREIICEEDYMEVNVDRESSCGGQRGDSGEMWHAAFSQAQRMASSVWQLMFLQSDGQVSSMSISEAQRGGYSLTTGAQRVALRSQYKQPHAQLTTVDGVPVEVVRVSLFFKKKMTVMMIDMSMACTVNSGSFDGARLLWDVPLVVPPLVDEGAVFESQSLGLGLEGVLLDEHTARTRGYSLVQRGPLVQIGVPFGAEGGYRKSSVVNNMYKETFVIFLLYEHVFSLLYEDGSIDTRHRMLRVLDTPLLCRQPFHLDQTVSDDRVFSVYLGNIPADVTLEDVSINGNQLMMSQSDIISPVFHNNGSRAYELRLPFEDAVVRWMYLGQGVVQYSIDVNFTLTIMPQKDSYYHLVSIKARALNTFPPEITAQCSGGGITFSVVIPPQAERIWEVGVGHEALTSEMAAQRGYRLHGDAFRTTLEVPAFSVGYTYDGVTLSNFYGTFRLLLRDSKTLEVQTSTSKRCLFKTEDMIVCSADGTMVVVTTPTATWPSVQPDRTTLLDPNCKPKQTDGSRVLFEFNLDSCGTRALVGESYMVYENEILHDRQLISDGPNVISRESQFKLTVRCFYPLSGINRLSVDQVFTSETPGLGSIKVFKSLKGDPDSADKLPATDCLHQVSGNAFNIPTNQVHQTAEPAAGAVLPLSQNHRFQTSRLHPAPYSAELHNSYIPADTKHITAKNTESSLSPASEPTSAATGRVGPNPERPGVQNIRVKPPSRFFSSGLQLNQEPVFHQANSQISNPTAVSMDGNRWPPRQLPGHRGPNVRDERTDLSTLDHQRLPGPSPDHQRLPGPSPDHQRLPGPSPDHQRLHGPSLHHQRLPDPSLDHQRLPDPSLDHQRLPGPSPDHQRLSDPSLDHQRLPDPSLDHQRLPGPSPDHQRLPGPSPDHQRLPGPSPDHQRLPGPSPDHQRLPGPSPDHQRLPDPSTDHQNQQKVYLYPNQQKRVELALVQSVSETGNGGGQEVPQTGASNLRIAPGLSGRLQTWHQPKLQNLQNLSVPNSPSAGGTGFTGSDLQTAGSDCGAQYGASDHQGILRGQRLR
ncbi:uncharacterized protein LOC116061107 isoform X1 [Sander lucioperca]|uniref:uncharacterized protein LOC116061107 isoform X1 n=1 Tax=Sander lucioperca TaxID=283035 RepID=UPI00125DCED9|nr:uncharacterized protein LOC116061107 isoform X1 [Sander lucioperca]